MTRQICDIYGKLGQGGKGEESVEPSYIEYIVSEKNYLSSDRFLKNKIFWNERFKDLPQLSSDKRSERIEGRRKTFELGWELTATLKSFVEMHKYSLNTFFVTLYLLYLYKTTQQIDIVIGTPVLNRSGRREKSIFGMFTSTMPFRFTIDENATLLETMARVNEELKMCYVYQKYPYDLLVQDLELKKRGYDTLFTSCVNYYNTKLDLALGGFPVENSEFYNGHQLYSLQLIIRDWSGSGSLRLDFDCNADDYTEAQINDLSARLFYLIQILSRNPSEKLRNICVILESEREKLIYRFNTTEMEYPRDTVIYRLFEEQVERTPDKVAVSSGKEELTYHALNARAN